MKHLNLSGVNAPRFGRPWLVAFVLCVFAPGFGHAESTTGDAAQSHRQAAPPEDTRASPHAKPAPRSGQQALDRTHGVDARPPTPSGATNPRVRAAAAPHVTASGLKLSTAAAVPTIVGRRAVGAVIIGGPAKYDARHGAIVGGTVSGRKH